MKQLVHQEKITCDRMLHEKGINIFTLLYFFQQLLALNILLVPYYKHEETSVYSNFLFHSQKTKNKKRTKPKALVTLL